MVLLPKHTMGMKLKTMKDIMSQKCMVKYAKEDRIETWGLYNNYILILFYISRSTPDIREK